MTASRSNPKRRISPQGKSGAKLLTKQDFVEEVKKLTGGAGVEYVIDGVGKTTFAKSLDALKTRGRATLYGYASGPADPVAPSSLMAKSLTLSVGSLGNYTATRDEFLRRAGDVFAGLREGWLKLRVDRTFPLGQAAGAHQLLESRQTTGKLILNTH